MDGLTTNIPAGPEHGAIAIVGMGCRFPGGVNSPNEFWQLMIEGRDAIVDVPPDRWDIRKYFDPDPNKPGKMYTRSGGFLQQRIDQFDAQFFGISPREAACTDPQQRLLLEVAWEALEDAGLVPEGIAGSDAGVYIGAFMLDNKLTQMSAANSEMIGPHTAVSSTMTILSNRLSYVFDLRGPSVSMDTACSSSLVAFHHACQAIWRGECHLALAGGVNVIFRPEVNLAMCKGQFLSPDGRCKSFDERADGYGRGEGAGIVVIKPLSDALRDGNPVYAIVRGTGVNQDGRTNGITVPNPASQERLILKVCGEAGVEPKQIRYFEAHGTGTAVGDPIEAKALGAAVGTGRDPEHACVVGSVKANIGHLEAASGVAGLIKAALSLKHGQIPPLANLGNPNPNIPFAELGLRLPRSLEPMPSGEGRAVVGINSFGYGGTNAHVLLEEAPELQGNQDSEPVAEPSRPCLLPLSARSDAALSVLANSYQTLLCGAEPPALRDLCYSAALHRGHYDNRLALVADSAATMLEQLRSFAELGRASRTTKAKILAAKPERPVFVFTGMGPQWWAMGRELLEQEPVFRDTATACDTIFRGLAGWSILAEMRADEKCSRITETQIAQPANFVIQASLVALWRSWGVEPAAVVGHSVGEVTAAYVAGVLSLEDAVRVSYQRSRIQKQAAGQGTMLAVGITEADVEHLLLQYRDQISLAAVNGPSSLTLAGRRDALEGIAAELERRGAFNRLLQVEVAYHSFYMDPLLGELRDSLSDLRTQRPRLPLYSTVTGGLVQEPSYDAEYWCRNVREPVLFARAMDSLIEAGHRLFLEVGPHPVLSASIKECLMRRGAQAAVIASMRRGESEQATMLLGLGGLYVHGCPVDWRQYYPQGGRFVRLPSYPWQRETYWQEAPEAMLERRGGAEHIFLTRPVSAPAPTWEVPLNRYLLPYLEDHRVDDLVVLPGAAYVEGGLIAHRQLTGAQACALENLEFHQALVVEDAHESLLRLTYDGHAREYSIYSRAKDDKLHWRLHATGTLSQLAPPVRDHLPLSQLRERCRDQVTADAHYRRMAERGLQYGPQFQGIQSLWRGDDQVLARIEVEQSSPTSAEGYRLHPTLLDAAFQSLIAILDRDDGAGSAQLYLPVRIDQIRFHDSPQGHCWSYGCLTRRTPELVEGDLTLCGDDGQVLVEVRGLQCRAVAVRQQRAIENLDQWLYRYHWETSEPERSLEQPGTWLLFADQGGIGEELASQIEAWGGNPAIRVLAADRYERLDANHYRLRPDSREDLQRLLEQVGSAGCQGIAYLWGLDAQLGADQAPGRNETIAALYLIQALNALEGVEPPRLYLITRGVQRVLASESDLALAQAPLVGLGRVAFNEHPALRCTLVDLDPSAFGVNVRRLAEELLTDGNDDDIALRGPERYLHRLRRVSARVLEQEAQRQLPIALPAGAAFALERDSQTGAIPGMRLRQIQRREPEPGEVEIAVRAVGLNPRDGDARGPSATGPKGVGRVASGIVTAVGTGVSGFQVGDPVFACAEGAGRSHLTVAVDAAFVVAKPPAGSFAAATSVPFDYVPAYYALQHVARVQRGEYVLIVGSGAAAMAAAQIALQAEARVLAGASTPDHADALRALGVRHVVEPASLDLAQDVMEHTGGHGLDVAVISSDAECEARISALLAPFGRLVRFDAARRGRAGTAASANCDITIASFDTERMMVERPGLYRQLLGEVCERIGSGALPVPERALLPPSETARVMQAGTQSPEMSAFALSMAHEEGAEVFPPTPERARIRPDATYLITGGFGGFGLKVAEWMVAQGARHLVLVGRRGAATADAQEAVRQLEAAGAKVMAAAADIATETAVVQLLDVAGQMMPPIKGIIHAAAVLDDARLIDLDAERFARVMAPKALGAWHLHQHTRDLEFFLLFSSVSCLIGNARQGNYVAANAVLDTLAELRRAQGMPATTINWGALAQVGMAASSSEVERHLALMGIKTFTSAQAMEALASVLEWNPVQVGIMDVDWQQWAMFEPTGGASSRFADLVGRDHGGVDSPASELHAQLSDLEPDERRELIGLLLAEQVAETLRMPTDRVDMGQALSDMGVDSLMAVELQTGIKHKFGIEISTLELMKGNSLAQMALHFLDKLGLAGDRPAAECERLDSSHSADSRDLDDGLGELSDEDLDTLLIDLMQQKEA